jgi:glycosyltransferase involved in cell wall biosynthesis
MVSIIVPAYRSHVTVRDSLKALLAQTYPHFEIVVIDSSPDATIEDIIRSEFPTVNYHHVKHQLFPHAARNLGVEKSHGDLLAFTDPDIYTHPNWLQNLVATHQATSKVVVGAIICHGRRWLDIGMHFSKFDQWLPAEPPRAIEISLTGSMLIPRSVFLDMDRFESDHYLADTLLSWKLDKAGIVRWFEPRAVAEHHHLQPFREHLIDLRWRGEEFGGHRIREKRWQASRIALHLVVTLLPMRLMGLMLRVLHNAVRAGLLVDYLRTWPVILSSEMAWLWGEACAYWAALRNLMKSQSISHR